MATTTKKPSAAELASRCNVAARYLGSAATALKHGRLSTARQKIRDALDGIALVQEELGGDY